MAFTNALAREREQSLRQAPIRRDKTKSTLGDLVVALTEETRCYVRDRKEVYRSVAHMVNDLLTRRRCLSKNWQKKKKKMRRISTGFRRRRLPRR